MCSLRIPRGDRSEGDEFAAGTQNMASSFLLQDRVRTGSRPGSHPQQAAATTALTCPALCQGCWKWQQLLCQGSCTLLSRCCALYAASPGAAVPCPSQGSGSGAWTPSSLSALTPRVCMAPAALWCWRAHSAGPNAVWNQKKIWVASDVHQQLFSASQVQRTKCNS